MKRLPLYTLAPAMLIVCSGLVAGCASMQSTHGCPGDRIGELDCSGAVCKPSYAGEVFDLFADEPANAQELLRLVEVSRFSRKLWYASNTGKFKLYVGGPNNGYAYTFSQGPAGWVATFERDAYVCTG
jgi:hypothetical protein